MAAPKILEQEFASVPQLLRLHAQARPDAPAVQAADESLTYRQPFLQLQRSFHAMFPAPVPAPLPAPEATPTAHPSHRSR